MCTPDVWHTVAYTQYECVGEIHNPIVEQCLFGLFAKITDCVTIVFPAYMALCKMSKVCL